MFPHLDRQSHDPRRADRGTRGDRAARPELQSAHRDRTRARGARPHRRRTESDRRHRDRAADEAKRTAAHDLGLHVLNNDQVLYPDAQLDIEDAEGRSGRVNVEIVSDHYHAAAITAKAAAGYAMHGSSRSATRKIARALARESDRG